MYEYVWTQRGNEATPLGTSLEDRLRDWMDAKYGLLGYRTSMEQVQCFLCIDTGHDRATGERAREGSDSHQASAVG